MSAAVSAPAPNSTPSERARGFTLIEVTVVLALSALLLTLVVPSALAHATKARRADAAAALLRLHIAQEQYRAANGFYAAEQRVLRGAFARSDGGYYDLALTDAQGDRFEAVASARSDGPQAGDHACPTLTLRVLDGQAQYGPSPDCWPR